jgi:diadenosine tetraphosphate (Ap4A) HIT family hydrolase
MPEFKREIFSNTDSADKLETATQKITQLLLPKLEKAKQLKYTSFQLTTQLASSKNDAGSFELSEFSLEKVYTSKPQAFSFPNVFAPIIKNSEKAKAEGTIFLTNEEDHIIIKDKYPSAPIHYLAIPKKDKITIMEMPVHEVAKLYAHAIDAALNKLTITQAKLLINVAPPNQEIPHVHLHIMSNDRFKK